MKGPTKIEDRIDQLYRWMQTVHADRYARMGQGLPAVEREAERQAAQVCGVLRSFCLSHRVWVWSGSQGHQGRVQSS